MKSLANINIKGKTNFDINFSGGDMTSDSGLALPAEFMRELGFVAAAEAQFGKEAPLRTYSDAELLIQKILMLLSSYSTDDEADYLAYDPMFKMLLGKKRLASQPTLSRFASRLDDESLIQLENLNKWLLQRAYKSVSPENMVLDLDTTLLPAYGKQDGNEYVPHYDAQGFQPIAVFDGLTGDLIRTELRKGSMYGGKDVNKFLAPVLEKYNRDYPGTNILVRGDSGFAMPKLYGLVESYDYKFVIRLKHNPRLAAAVQDVADELAAEAAMSDKTYLVRYGDFYYQANSWSKARRVVFKIEFHRRAEQELFPDPPMFIVTNLEASAMEVIAAYCKRGTMENFFKEAKNEFAFAHMSSHSFVTNANKLQITALAYNIFNLFRRLCLNHKWQSFRAHELRLRLLKIAGRATKHAGRIIFRLCSSCPYQKEFYQTHERILQLRAAA